MRSNWQVGMWAGCQIEKEGELEGCPETESYIGCGEMYDSERCGDGPMLVCQELHCNTNTKAATDRQRCVLERANTLGCAFEQEENPIVEWDSDGEYSCPREECEWRWMVVGEGCIQNKVAFKDCGEIETHLPWA